MPKVATDKKPKTKPRHSEKSKSDYSLWGFKYSVRQMVAVGIIFAAIGGFFIWKTFASGVVGVSVHVNEPTQPKSFSLYLGEGTSIIWTTTNANACSGTGPGGWNANNGATANGSTQSQPTGAFNSPGTYTYTVTCEGFDEASDSVTVTAFNEPSMSITANGSNNITTTSGDAVNIVWNGTTSPGASGCSSSWGAGIGPNGSQTFFPTASGSQQTYTYTVQCGYFGGRAPAATATVHVNPPPAPPPPPPPPPPAPTAFINAKDPAIDKGASTTLTWGSSNASSCSASGAWSGTKGASGSQNVSPATSSTYVITCSGNGSATASTSVTVRGTPPPPAAPAVKLIATPSSVAYNGITFLQWSSSNVNSSNPCSASWTSNKSANNGAPGVKVGPLTATKTYSISCSGPGGTATDSATVSVGKAPVGCPPNCPKPAAPAAPTKALAAPTPTSTSAPEDTPTFSDDFSSTEGDNTAFSQSKKHRNWLRDFLLGGLLGVLTGQTKGAK